MFMRNVKVLSIFLLCIGALSAADSTKESVCEHCGLSLSNAFIEVAKKCRPSVVHIRGEQNKSGVGAYRDFGGADSTNPFEQFQEELFNRFFGFPSTPQQAPQQKQTPISTGSGFIVSQDGYIVTNYHVVKDVARIVVEKYDDVEKEFEAELVGCDPNTDIAILKIPGKDLPCIAFADSDQIQVGQWTMAIGHPFRLRDSVTAGVISATHRGDLQISQLEDFIQTDTSINPGNSGGPLLDLSGKVIGMNTAILSRSGGNIGVGFAVPSNIISMVYEQIRQKGMVDRAYLGVQIQDLTDDLCAGFKMKKGTTGALVTEVVPDSVAQTAGLVPGDIIVEFNGESIKNAKQLYNSLGKLPSGSQADVKVLHDGKQKKIQMALGSKTKEVSLEGDLLHKLGVVVEAITPENANKYNVKSDEKGLVITRVLPGTTAAIAGWHEGSIIMVINGQKVSTIADLKKVLEKSDPKERVVLLMHFRGRASFFSVPHPMG